MRVIVLVALALLVAAGAIFLLLNDHEKPDGASKPTIALAPFTEHPIVDGGADEGRVLLVRIEDGRLRRPPVALARIEDVGGGDGGVSDGAVGRDVVFVRQVARIDEETNTSGEVYAAFDTERRVARCFEIVGVVDIAAIRHPFDFRCDVPAEPVRRGRPVAERRRVDMGRHARELVVAIDGIAVESEMAEHVGLFEQQPATRGQQGFQPRGGTAMTSTTVLDSLLFRDAFGTPRMRAVRKSSAAARICSPIVVRLRKSVSARSMLEILESSNPSVGGKKNAQKTRISNGTFRNAWM